MSYYYQGTSLSTICNYITSAQDNVQNLKIAKKTDYTSLGITETPTKTGFYNATHTDYSTFCIAYYTENQLVSIPSWCRQLRIVMIGGGGSGTTYQGGDHQHVNAVNTHNDTQQHVAAVHTHTANKNHRAAVNQAAVQQHQHVVQNIDIAASDTILTKIHESHTHIDSRIFRKSWSQYDRGLSRQTDDRTGGGNKDILSQFHNHAYWDLHHIYKDTVAAFRYDHTDIQHERPMLHTAAIHQHQVQQYNDNNIAAVQQAAVQQDQQQNQQDQTAQHTEQKTHNDVPVQHKDTPTAGAGGGGGAFVYISTFQVSNVTSPSMSANSNNVYLSFAAGGTNYSIVANGGGNSSGTSAGSGGTVTVSNIQQQGDATQQTLQGQTWLQGRSSAGQNGQGQNGGSSSGGAGGDCNIINNTFMKQYGIGGSTSSTGGGSTYYRVYYLTN